MLELSLSASITTKDKISHPIYAGTASLQVRRDMMKSFVSFPKTLDLVSVLVTSDLGHDVNV